MRDFATKERRAFIERVSPFHPDDPFLPYAFAWIAALFFGTPMPHERRGA